jgi:16S rRNA (guanine527-N7)-methyltransferase
LKTADITLLKEGAREFGAELSESQLRLFTVFLERLCLWNRRINLTGISNKREMVLKLFLDPLAALPYLPSTATVLDIGSGAGIPGLPLKIVSPELEVHLLESKSKKISFLRDTIRNLGLKGIGAHQGRAEKKPDLPPEMLPFYDIVIARALASLEKTIIIGHSFLGSKGVLITYKGSKVEQEIKESETVMEKLHLRISKTASYSLPGIEGERYLLVIERKG